MSSYREKLDSKKYLLEWHNKCPKHVVFCSGGTCHHKNYYEKLQQLFLNFLMKEEIGSQVSLKESQSRGSAKQLFGKMFAKN